MRLLRAPRIGNLLDVGRSRDGARKPDRLLASPPEPELWLEQRDQHQGEARRRNP